MNPLDQLVYAKITVLASILVGAIMMAIKLGIAARYCMRWGCE